MVRPVSKYRIAPHVLWSVEDLGITLIDTVKGEVYSLRYPHAAVWDLISRGYPFKQILSMLCAIVDLEMDKAEQILIESLRAWTSSGFLINDY